MPPIRKSRNDLLAARALMSGGGLPAEIALDIVERRTKPFNDARQQMEKSFLPLAEKPATLFTFNGRPVSTLTRMTTPNDEHSMRRLRPYDSGFDEEVHTLKIPNDGRPFGGMFYRHQTPYI